VLLLGAERGGEDREYRKLAEIRDCTSDRAMMKVHELEK